LLASVRTLPLWRFLTIGRFAWKGGQPFPPLMQKAYVASSNSFKR
jgi:hypothetical protein